MKTSLYLYGQQKDWGHMPYDEAIKKKIKLANIELSKEYKRPMMDRCNIKIVDLDEAIRFNEVLLNE